MSGNAPHSHVLSYSLPPVRPPNAALSTWVEKGRGYPKVKVLSLCRLLGMMHQGQAADSLKLMT